MTTSKTCPVAIFQFVVIFVVIFAYVLPTLSAWSQMIKTANVVVELDKKKDPNRYGERLGPISRRQRENVI